MLNACLFHWPTCIHRCYHGSSCTRMKAQARAHPLDPSLLQTNRALTFGNLRCEEKFVLRNDYFCRAEMVVILWRL